MPKNHRGRHNKKCNWLVVAIEEGTAFFRQLVRKTTRPALETITHECAKPGTHIKTDERKSYFWLGKTTNARTFQPSGPALHTHSTVCHKKSFKAADSTCTNKVEGQNSVIKGPHKAMKGLPKNLMPMCLDQIMFEGFANCAMPFSSSSHSQSEKDKTENVKSYYRFALLLSKALRGKRRFTKVDSGRFFVKTPLKIQLYSRGTLFLLIYSCCRSK